MSKKKHSEHHGGAWKVAYADFVTAMMALFMVLWISAQAPEIVLATAEYFRNPFSAISGKFSGIVGNDLAQSKSTTGGGGNATASAAVDMAFFKSLAKGLSEAFNMKEDEVDKPVDIIVTSDGIRVLLYNKPKHPLFEKDALQLTDWGDFVMQNIAWLIERHEMSVRIDGYGFRKPDAKDFVRNLQAAPADQNGPWDLALGRANIIRSSLVYYGLTAGKIKKIVGYVETLKEGESDDQQRVIEISLLKK
ncbi:MAG: hypothetical protein A2Y14_02055 [Verrucomicrobia bacterium GWF2_51_19]|nr:MAG: hypothetical protein A2Y14_02055 [Verrucomicrobia bacterium GWF2_51_19]HCJ12048.1 hypothetical protein [Opitutae bacterium]